jgi:universal stress protein A
MFKKILCPVDFSEYTPDILNYAAGLAKQFGAELHLLHVIPNLSYFSPYESFLTPDNLSAIERNIEAEVDDEYAKATKDLGLPVRKVTRKGVAFVEIIDYIKAEEIDLVVMGTHGRSGVEHILIGSVAEKVVRKAPCPVLTIRPRGHRFRMP